MKRLKEFIELLKNGEKRSAFILLDKISKENECRGYSAALEKILLTEAAKELNDSVPSFYYDTEALKKQLFSENPPQSKDVVDALYNSLCESVHIDEERAYIKAKEYIDSNLADNQLSVGVTAEYSGIHQSVLLELFRKNDGVTIVEYINKTRVEKSLSLLMKNESVSSAAEKVGFSSTEAYIRAFKKNMGTTPGLWKRNKLFL